MSEHEIFTNEELKIIKQAKLKYNEYKPEKNPHNFKDITGMKYNQLKVLYRTLLNNESKWVCLCDCGNLICVKSNSLTSNNTKSCGCYHAKKNHKQRKYNTYDLSGEYGIGWTSNTNKEFYFDLEDYDKIKNRCWSENKNGYIRCCINNKDVFMHRLVMDVFDSEIVVDHKKHKNYDNRKSELRITNDHCNTMNEKLAINNTSGITGVSWEDKTLKWHAYIWYNGKSIHLGRFDKKEDAIKARKDAEEIYFGEYSYDNSMKEAN